MAKVKQDPKDVSVLAFEKKIVPSNGMMYETIWEKREELRIPLPIEEKTVRGTISNTLKDSVLNDPMKLSEKIENPNIQTVDCCYLKKENDTLVTSFTVKMLGNIDVPTACSNPDFLEKYKKVVESYKNEYGFEELSFRYAYNIAAARFLWRNRLGTEKIEVKVRDCFDNSLWTFDSKSFPLRSFDFVKKKELQAFSHRIAEAFKGNSSALFEVTCYAKIGKGQEVYPSEEMVLNKLKDDKSKILYSVDGIAAFHSQKIGNAIRTIDTWYPLYGTKDGVGPIAIDPYGPVTTISRAFRSEKGTDFYSIKDSFIWENNVKKEEDKHFFMAIIIRGGVFGKKSEKDNESLNE